MLVNCDFARRAVVTPDRHQWVPSPQAGVHRLMLDRLGGELARATSLVRYEAGSRFPRHAHPGGEEILVLDGVFSDEAGDYPAGWYLRNPPGSSHQPSSACGATIFVKLFQMPPGAQEVIRVDTRDPANWSRTGECEVCPLYSDAVERTVLRRLPRAEPVLPATWAGGELLVLEGALVEKGSVFPQGSWLRIPACDGADLRAGQAGATLYVKTGHLRHMERSA